MRRFLSLSPGDCQAVSGVGLVSTIRSGFPISPSLFSLFGGLARNIQKGRCEADDGKDSERNRVTPCQIVQKSSDDRAHEVPAMTTLRLIPWIESSQQDLCRNAGSK